MADHDLVAERAVLGALLLEPSRFDEAASVVGAADFYRLPHAHVWRAMARLHESGVEIDYKSVSDALQADKLLDEVQPLYLADLVDGVPKSSNIGYYAATVRDLAERRALLRVLASTVATIDADGVTADALGPLKAVLDLPAGGRIGVTAAHEYSVLTDMSRERIRRDVRRRLDAEEGPIAGRQLTLTAASTITIAPVNYLWHQRMAVGSFGLLAGREEIGKSALGFTLAAGITRGTLPGACYGRPSAVIIVAGEDSWSHTIVPRLMAAGADLARVFRVDVMTPSGGADSLCLPLDVSALATAITNVGAVLVVLDPLLSRLDGALDSHKDADVRRALEPLAALADETGACLLGLIHLNKSTTSDPLSMLMASRAFAAVARWVLFATADPADEARRLLGLVKNNLGPCDLPTLAYGVVGHLVGKAGGDEVWTGRLEWLGESATAIRDAVADTSTQGDRTATAEALDWLQDYLTASAGSADSSDVKRDGHKAGHSHDALKRARQRLGCAAISSGFPRRTAWTLPASAQSEHARGGTAPTAPTAPTGDISNDLSLSQSVQTVQSVQSVQAPREVLQLDDPPKGASHAVRI